jgi:hypothetical protein
MEKHQSLYYEAHVTVEPLFGDKLDIFKKICREKGFTVADLLMQRRKEDTPERSKNDSFCTGRSPTFGELKTRMVEVIETLKANQIKVWRYKIEDTLLDSKIQPDPLGILK